MISNNYVFEYVNNLLKERYYDKGISPSSEQVQGLMAYAKDLNLSVNGSRVKFEPHAESESSASNLKKSLSAFNVEIKTIIKSCKDLNKHLSYFYNGAENRLSLLNQRVSDLLLQSCALQVARAYDFNLVAAETFIDFTKINQQETSAELDFATSSVTLKRALNQSRYDLSYLTNDNFDLFIVDGEYKGFGDVPGSEYLNLVDDLDGFWMTRLLANENTPKTIALQITFDKLLIFNEIEFRPFASNQAGNQYVRFLASKNAITWQEISPLQKLTSKINTISFSSIEAKYLRIEMRRDKPSFATLDNNALLIYEFGMDALRIFKSTFFRSGDFVSKPIEFKNIDGTAQNINRVYFEPYHEIPTGTKITYYLTTGNLNSAIKIEPSQIIELNTVDTIKSNGKVRSRFDINHALINLTIPSNVITETIRFFRNIYQENVFINGIQAGWQYADSYYSCIFELSAQKEINLGINYAYINGKKVNGVQTLDPGIYSFKTHENNWANAVNEASDPLFPYNHKLLIEGLKNSSVYTGADFVAAGELQMISAFDLINNLSNSDKNRFFGLYGEYPIVKIDKPPAFITEIEGWRKEQYQIRYKIPSSSKAPITQVTLIAKLNSVSSAISPKLMGYVLAAGY